MQTHYSPPFLDAFLYSLQITGWIDEGLNEKAYIIPGLGDFGERRYANLIRLTLAVKHSHIIDY